MSGRLTPFRVVAAEAIREQARATQVPQPGHWMIRCCRLCPEVAARIWFCDHEPGFPENKVDQPYLQGQIGLELVDPIEIWTSPKREIIPALFDREIEWHRWAAKNRPSHPEHNFRKAVAKAAMPPPRFARKT